ncbi:MAG: hypothetical protein ACXVIG_07200 [Halobacteriota archaeon]
MRIRLSAFVLCAIIITTVVATDAVAAKTDSANAGESNIQHYDVLSWMAHDKVVGKLTIDVKTGHYVVTVNYGKGGLKDAAKQASKSGIVKAQNTAAQPWEITFSSVIMTKGGTLHGEGTLTNAINHPDVKVVNWLDRYGSDAKIYLNFPD